jgi:hypothetical protein
MQFFNKEKLMFETHRESEIFLPKIFGEDEGIQTWGHVSKRLHTLWLYVICKPADKESDQLPMIFFISNIMDLLVFQNDTSAIISEVYVVSPNHLNGSDVWKMNLLDHILVGNEPIDDCEQHAYIYVLKNGQRLVDSALGTEEDDLENTLLLCQL